MQDRRLIQAAEQGDVKYLLNLIKEDPLVLRRSIVSLACGDNPLHIATIAGQLDFVKEVVKLRKEFAQELNQDGFGPLHIASANGDIEIVTELLKVDQGLCRVKGREKAIPLHCAMIRGRVEVIWKLLSACPDSVEAVTARGQTVLHLAVINNQFEAFQVLVEHIKEDLLNHQDFRGNTVLHLAASKKQYQVIDFLLTRPYKMEVNSLNKIGFTPLDVLVSLGESSGDMDIEEILHIAGATRAGEEGDPKSVEAANPIEPNEGESPPSKVRRTMLKIVNKFVHPQIEALEYFKYKKDRDSPSDARNCVLVIAALIATATYQGLISPPGGLWQDDSKPHSSAGYPILQTLKPFWYGFFLYFNTMGFSVSVYMMLVLVRGFPMQLQIQQALVAFVIAYDLSVVACVTKRTSSVVFVALSMCTQLSLPKAGAFYKLAMKLMVPKAAENNIKEEQMKKKKLKTNNISDNAASIIGSPIQHCLKLLQHLATLHSIHDIMTPQIIVIFSFN